MDLKNGHVGIGVALESFAIGLAHVNVVDTGYFQLQPLIAVGLEAVQLVQNIRSRFVRVAGKVPAIHRELELLIGQGDGQLKLLINHEWEGTVTLFC